MRCPSRCVGLYYSRSVRLVLILCGFFTGLIFGPQIFHFVGIDAHEPAHHAVEFGEVGGVFRMHFEPPISVGRQNKP